MYLATLAGLAFGKVADRHVPVSGDWFLLAAVASILCLAVATCRRAGPVPARPSAVSVREHTVGLAAFAALLLVTDPYSAVEPDSVVPQILGLLPFLVGLGSFVRRGAWLAAIGSGGFYATLVGMLFLNGDGSWIGFLSRRCR